MDGTIVERKMERYGEARAATVLPDSCPYTVEQVFGDWLPETEARSSVAGMPPSLSL